MPPDRAALDCPWAGAALDFGADAYKDKIEFFKSTRPGAAPGVDSPDVAEDGRGGADCVPPKKSSPSRLSPGLVCLGCAAGAFERPDLPPVAGSVVLGLTGALSVASPNKSTCAWAFAGRGCALPRLTFRSILAFSCTTFKGTSSSAPSSSNVLGSGMGPSITQRLLSYFVRMKFSILASLGTWPAANLCSQYLFARAFPQRRIDAICWSVHESRSTDFTREMWTPKLRWMPEQRMQTKTPRFHEAHLGCLLRLQSAQDLFDSSFTSCFSVALFCSLRSGGGARRDIFSGRGFAV